MSFVRLVAVCLFVGSTSSSAPAATPTARPPRQALGEGAADAEPLAISLEAALEAALANDLGLALEGVNAEVASFTFAGSWGRFDPVVRASAAYTNSQVQQFVFAGGGFQTIQFDAETKSASAGIDYPLTTGGTLSADLDYSRTDGFNAPLPVSSSLALNFNQPLLRGRGENYATSQQRENELRYLKQVERIRQTRQALYRQVSDAYWDLVSAREQLLVADETLALGREQLEQNKRRLAAGVGTEVEVLQAETNIAQRVEQQLLRRVAVKNAEDRLKGLMHPGKSPQTWERELAPTSKLPEQESAPSLDWKAGVAVALQKRSELKQQALEIDASEQGLVRAVSERRPSVDLGLQARSAIQSANEGDAFDDVFGWELPQTTVSLNFSTPLGNRQALNNERLARASIRAARITYDRLESQIVEEVRVAERNARYQLQAVQAAAASRALAERQLSWEQSRYREGLSTNFQVLEFQQQLAESRYSHTLARANLVKALTQLEFAQGVLGERAP
jgi:outer membrane protein TolC